MRKNVLLHVIACAGYAFYSIYLDHKIYPDAPVYLWDRLTFIFSVIGVFYATSLFILPRFFNTKKYFLVGLSSVVLFEIFWAINYWLDYIFYPYMVKGANELTFEWQFFTLLAFRYFMQYYVYGIAFWFAKNTINQEREKRLIEEQRRLSEEQKYRLEEEKNAAEVEALRAKLAFYNSQFNPHFLYNTLNSFYSIAYNVHEGLAEGIAKLSHMLRYSLNESPDADKRVHLSEEVECIRQVIDLHQIRFGNKLEVDFKVDGDVEQKRILPLLLINFVENAFKHGKLTDATDPLIIHLSAYNGSIKFFLKNQKGRKNRQPSAGLGIENVRKRLDLIYSDQYLLDIQEDDKNYACSLTIYDPA